MDRFVLIVEKVAGAFLGIVAALTFFEIAFRLVGLQIPDWFILACMFQGIAIFWGIASTTYEGKHIAVDVFWEMSGPAGRRLIDIVGTLVTTGFLGVFAWMVTGKVESTYSAGQVSNELEFQLWPFHLAAALGIVCAALMAAIRLWRLARPER